MRINKTERIAGVPIPRVRDYLRTVRQPYTFRKGDIKGYFDVSDREAAEILRELSVRGFVEPVDREGRYQLTVKGNALTAARAIPPMSRAKAERPLAEFLERVAEVNRRDELAYYVAEVRVFGSYLNKRAKDLGDLDFGVDIRWRETPGRDFEACSRKRARAWGRRFSSWIAMMAYGQIEVMRLLVARSPTFRCA